MAKDPNLAIAEVRSMNTIEGNYPDGGNGNKHSVTKHQRLVMNYAYYQMLRPAPL